MAHPDTLSAGDVHVWTARPDRFHSDRSIRHFRDVLDEDEIRKMERFRFEKDAHHYLVAHGMLRHLLSRYVNREPGALHFKAGPMGKPELNPPARGDAVEFNLTHTGGLVACAISRQKVGIDAESTRRPFDLGVAKKVLTANELEDVLAPPNDILRRSQFLLHWTLKEAYVKARGLGLSADLKSFGFRIRDSGGSRTEVAFMPPSEDRHGGWQFMQTPAARYDGIPLAVAVNVCPETSPLEFSRFEFEDS